MLHHNIKRLSSKWHCVFKGKIMYLEANKWVCEFGSLPPSLLTWVLSLGLMVDKENWLPKVVLLPRIVHPYLWRHTCTHTQYKIYSKIFVLQKLFLSALCFRLNLIYVFNQSVLVPPVKGILLHSNSSQTWWQQGHLALAFLFISDLILSIPVFTSVKVVLADRRTVSGVRRGRGYWTLRPIFSIFLWLLVSVVL